MRGGVTGCTGVATCSLGRALDGREDLSGPNMVSVGNPAAQRWFRRVNRLSYGL